MYIPKFDYKPIPRTTVDGKRLYSTPDGGKLPSVTTILDVTKPAEDKRALMEWRNRVGVDEAQKITTAAATRGTIMHSFLEDWIKSGEPISKPDDQIDAISWNMANIIIDNGLAKCNEFWGIEVPLYFPAIYAGTTDCVGIFDGKESIIDFKQSNKPKKREWINDYFLQLVAYSICHDELYGTNIKQGVIMMCVKPAVDDGNQIISPPVYQEFILAGEEFEKYNDLWWRRLEQYVLKTNS